MTKKFCDICGDEITTETGRDARGVVFLSGSKYDVSVNLSVPDTDDPIDKCLYCVLHGAAVLAKSLDKRPQPAEADNA